MGVAWTGSEDDFLGFIDEHQLSFPQLSDDPGDVYDRFGIPYQPAFVVVRPDGQVETLLGAADDDVIDMLVESAMS